jgi:hypothetical protein
MAAWGLVISVRCRKVPAGRGRRRRGCDRARGAVQATSAPGVLGDPGREKRQPAQDDVGADPVLAPVAGPAQVDDLLDVAPAAHQSRMSSLTWRISAQVPPSGRDSVNSSPSAAAASAASGSRNRARDATSRCSALRFAALGPSAVFQERREVRPGPQLGDRQLDRPRAGVPFPPPVPVAGVDPVRADLPVPGATPHRTQGSYGLFYSGRGRHRGNMPLRPCSGWFAVSLWPRPDPGSPG